MAVNKDALKAIAKLDDFAFDENLLSCKRVGQFPDLAIRICKDDELFTGGELVELKDSKSYTVSSFNSTIPTAKKEIAKVVKGKNSEVLRQMIEAGDDVFALPEREVFYLIRGQNKNNCKRNLTTKPKEFWKRFFPSRRVLAVCEMSKTLRSNCGFV